MRLPILKTALFMLILMFCWVTLGQALEVPMLKGRINDYAGLLSPTAAQVLEQKLAAFERATGNQIVLLTIPSLQDETIESFATKVGDAWKIGQKGRDNGVIMILAKKEHKIRIEVGTGLQGVLPDITASRISRDVMVPRFRAGDFDGGVTAGMDAIIAATKGAFKATPADRSAAKHHATRGHGLFFILLLVGLVIVAAAGSTSRTAGALTGGVALPVAAGLGLGVTLGKLGILAILGAAAGLLISLLMRLLTAAGGGPPGGGFGGGGGGPTIFFGGGGGGDFPSGGDGGFSGGGGDFDGGGSSDDW